MKYSLINVAKHQDDGTVAGMWLQNHVGTVESAKIVAKSIEYANSNKIEVAVVDEIISTCPALGYWRDLKPL